MKNNTAHFPTQQTSSNTTTTTLPLTNAAQTSIVPPNEFYSSYDSSRFSWWRYLADTRTQAAPLESFPYTPCYEYAQHIIPGTVVEVLNPDAPHAYWFAEIIQRAGLKIQIRYVGCPELELWLNATDVYPMGYCLAENKRHGHHIDSTPKPAAKQPETSSANGRLPGPASFKPPQVPKNIAPEHYLIPPQSIIDQYTAEQIQMLILGLADHPTLPNDFHLKALPQQPVGMGDRLEIVDKAHIACMRVAYINELPHAGGRIRLRYETSQTGAVEEFWANIHSSIVHPIGWSKYVGHKIILNESEQQNYTTPPTGFKNTSHDAFTYEKTIENNYRRIRANEGRDAQKMDVSCKNNASSSIVIIDNTTEKGENSQKVHLHLLNCSSSGSDENNNSDGGFEVGMKLEAIDPLNLSNICPATVVRVLKKGYLMIGIDGSTYNTPITGRTNSPSTTAGRSSPSVQLTNNRRSTIQPLNGTTISAEGEGASGVNGSQKHANIFCYHSKSSSIMPAGFCELADIRLTTPHDWSSSHDCDTFTWAEYLEKNKGSRLAPPHLFSNRIPRHTFKIGHKLEAVDLMEPSLLCVATVKQTAGRLLRIGFDGWGAEYDQWVDCHSPDIYPCGYCELVRQTLQPPRGHMQTRGVKRRSPAASSSNTSSMSTQFYLNSNNGNTSPANAKSSARHERLKNRSGSFGSQNGSYERQGSARSSANLDAAQLTRKRRK